MRMSDWSSDVCSSDLGPVAGGAVAGCRIRGSAVCGGRLRHRLAALLEDVVAVPRQQLEIALRQSQPELLGIAMHPDVDERLALGEMGDLVAGDEIGRAHV